MIIKEADDKTPAIQALQALLSRPDCAAETRRRIEQEIRNIQAGVRGEEQAAYEMRVRWGESKNCMILHDLRIEVNGLVAQIDHLLINRLMEVWVCESKHCSEGLAINEHGEFSAFFGGKPYGVPSPLEQNAKHVLILKRWFDSGAVKLPQRLGFTIKPDLKSLVLVSKGARIIRPKAKLAGLDSIIKNDQISSYFDKETEKVNNPLLLAKLIGQDTLEVLARSIAQQHKPVDFDWAAKFGLSDEPPALNRQPGVQVVTDQPAATEHKPASKLVCHACSVAVSYNVARFCWNHRQRFGGDAYCMDCQKSVTAP